MSTTVRPSWHADLPSNFGSPDHGKLKADQWRSLFEFDLPVSLLQLWASKRDSRSSEENTRAWAIVENTMDLSQAADWATSNQTSVEHAERYKHFMQRYIEGLRRLYPDMDLVPNHHLALHLDQVLLKHGPIRGTWAFPFERLVGKLQKINTNFLIGV